MPRRIEGLIVGPCKIRKRGCSSSSSSSSIFQNYRLKRAILGGKKGGSSTPVPTWKMSSKSPAISMVRALESPKYPPPMGGGKVKQGPVSARKLAATLWEMNEIPSPRVREDLEEEKMVKKKEMRGREMPARSVRSGSLPRHLSDPTHSPGSEMIDRLDSSRLRRKLANVTQKITSSERDGRILDSMSNASLMEIEPHSRAATPSGSVTGTRSRLRDVSNGLTTSKELLKVLNRIWGLEEQHSSSISLIQALRVELERARLQVDQLIQEQKSGRTEINYLMKKFADEKAALKSREQDKIRAAVQPIAEELEVEKKSRRRTESINAKLRRELNESKASLTKVMKELEGEKRAREILEQICDELASGIGEDKAEVEELKRESAKVREELEKEREMLQLADVLREERVQMKLSEAKIQFEEKNAAVDMLRNELEAFLESQRDREIQNGCRSSEMLADREKEEGEVDDGDGYKESEEKEDDDDDDDNDDDDDDDDAEVDEGHDGSGESDLHSIELNMDNSSKGCMWSYAEDMEKRASMEEEGRWKKSTLDKNPKRLDRSLLEGIEWESYAENYRRNGIDQGRFSDSSILVGKEAKKGDYKSRFLKGLKNQILPSSKMGSARGYFSPARQSAESGTYQDPIEVVRQRLKVAEMVKGIRENSSKARLVMGKEERPNSRQKHVAP